MITSMTMDSSKRAVLINPFNTKLVCPLPTQSYTSVISYSDKIQIKSEVNSAHKKGRKRSLDHLSYEEKLQRKKLKNREAAQTSRDRKKARMDELEKTVKFLEKNNKQLRNEVNTLKSQKEDMHKENDRLKEELRCAKCALESTSGSAVSSIHPPPQGHSSHQSASSTLFLRSVFLSWITILTARWISNAIFWTNFFKISSHKQSRNIQRIPYLNPTKWWGRHQHSWNPVDWHYLSLPITIK